MQKQISSLENQLESVSRKLSKCQQNQAQLATDRSSMQEHTKRQNRQRHEDYQRKTAELSERLQQTEKQLQKATAQIKKLERELKTAEHQKSSLLKSFEQERQEVNHVKQQVMRDQISRLKKLYQSEVIELKRLCDLKEATMMDEVQRWQNLLKEREVKVKYANHDSNVLVDEIEMLRVQSLKLKAESTNMREKVGRMEQHNYILWTGLKDIKVLSSRLGLFNKFARIYEDIHFDDVAP